MQIDASLTPAQPILAKLYRRLLPVLALCGILAGCGGLESSSSSNGALEVNGAAVKGPLVNAGVAAYVLDPAQADLKGELVALGLTDARAQLDLQIPPTHEARGPFLLEYTGGTEINGSTPVIGTLTTVLTNQQLINGTAVYATPLTTFVIEHARHIADREAQASNPLLDGLTGNADGSVTLDEFLAALQTSTQVAKSVLGMGLLSPELDIFTTSPLLDGSAAAADTQALRTANEVFAALVQDIATEVAAAGPQLSGATILASLADDFSDGVFDSRVDGFALAELTNLSDISATLAQNPLQLLVPGTQTPVADIANLLASEATLLELNAPATPMPPQQLSAIVVSIFETGAATGDPDPAPEPEPEPEPEPVNTAPSVSFATPQANAQLQAGVNLSVALQASDSDNGIAHCDLSITGSFVGRDSSAPYLYTGAALTNLAAGSYTLAATCVDNAGLASSALRSITVLPAPEPEPEPEPVNAAPVVSITSPANGSSFQAGSGASVSVAASDSDGSIAYCDLSVNNSFIGRDSSAPYLFSSSSLSNLSAGSYGLVATCSDNQGLSSSAQSSITVTAPPEPPNVAPSASFASPAINQVFTAGDAIYVNINAQDSDGTVQNCSLTLNGNTVRTESSAPYEWGVMPGWTDAQFVDLAPGSYALVGRCTDDDNAATSIQRNFLVEAAPEIPPLVSFSTPAAGGTFQAGESIEVELAASDSDGNVAYCDLFFNGDLVGRDSAAPYRFSGAALASLIEGSHTLHASCFDNAGLTASAQRALVVEAAPTPTLANVLLDWIVPTTREDGSALPASDIESYEIYYYEGSNSAAGTSINVPAADVGGNLVTSYQVSGLASGNYFFSIATIDTDGNVSEFVEPVPLLIQ